MQYFSKVNDYLVDRIRELESELTRSKQWLMAEMEKTAKAKGDQPSQELRVLVFNAEQIVKLKEFCKANGIAI